MHPYSDFLFLVLHTLPYSLLALDNLELEELAISNNVSVLQYVVQEFHLFPLRKKVIKIRHP